MNSKVSIDEKYEKILLGEDKYNVLVKFLNQLVEDYRKLEEQFKDYTFIGTWWNYTGVNLNNINVITSLDGTIHINITIEVGCNKLGKRYDFKVDTSKSNDDFLDTLYINVYRYNLPIKVPTDHIDQLLSLYLLANFTSTSTYDDDGDYLADRLELKLNNCTEDKKPQDWDIVYTLESLLYDDYNDYRGKFSFNEDEVRKWTAEREVQYLKSILDKHNIIY